MSFFTSSREKQLWLCALAVLVAIYSTLILGQLYTKLFANQNVQAIIFLFGMLLVGVTILMHSLRPKTTKVEILILIGIAAVYMMLFLRLGIPERSHLFEYSVLAIFIHKALIEREKHTDNIRSSALYAVIISFAIGVIDECLQLFIPNRVFDPNDILFNGFAVTMAIGSGVVFTWVQNRGGKSKQGNDSE